MKKYITVRVPVGFFVTGEWIEGCFEMSDIVGMPDIHVDGVQGLAECMTPDDFLALERAPQEED